MVLLDPVWDLRNLQRNGSGLVHQILMDLPKKLQGLRKGDEGPHPLADKQPAIEHTLVCVIEVLAGQGAADYVNSFLDDYRPRVQIPVLEGYK
jgi:hypothetical protein